MAKLIRSDVNWTTEPRDFTDVDATQTHRIREIRDSPHRAYYGREFVYDYSNSLISHLSRNRPNDARFWSVSYSLLK